MAETLISPGVLARENDQSQITAGPIQAGAAIIGPTVKGQVEIPTLCTSYSDYVAKFGNTFESLSKAVPSKATPLISLVLSQSQAAFKSWVVASPLFTRLRNSVVTRLCSSLNCCSVALAITFSFFSLAFYDNHLQEC